MLLIGRGDETIGSGSNTEGVVFRSDSDGRTGFGAHDENDDRLWEGR